MAVAGLAGITCEILDATGAVTTAVVVAMETFETEDAGDCVVFASEASKVAGVALNTGSETGSPTS
jgi:hypothetical protein